MSPPRVPVSLGRTRWPGTSSPRLDPALSALLLDNITAKIAIIDRDHRYVYANREMLEFLGLPAAAVIGQHLADVVGTVAYRGYLPLAERVFAGEALRLEGWVEYPGQRLHYLRETFIPYAAAEGPIEIVAVFGRDHTDLKLREQELADRLAELQTSEVLKSAIVDHAFAALVSTDAEGRIVEFNPAAEAMFGRQRGEVLGRPVAEVMIPERHRAAHQAGMRRMQAGGAPRVLNQRLEMTATRAGGDEFPMEMVLWRTDARGGVFYTASIADLSERRDAAAEIERQREALRQSEKLTAMGSLLSGVAHELNNPLAIVLGRASLLEEKLEAQERVDPQLVADARRIREAAERCGRIVRTFLDMARQRPAQRRPVALNEMVRAAAEMLQYGYRTHGVVLEMALAGRLPTVAADSDQVGQIVMNLLVNAQQALSGVEAPRRVRVETGHEPRRGDTAAWIWLRVADNGPGVAPAARARLFEPFFTTKPEGAGTGLGLAVSRSLARDHGGDLSLEPAGASGGACFLLRLPVEGAAAAAAAVGVEPEVEAAFAARLLVVDDEAELAGLMREMLESAGYEVATAESAVLALELLEAARFDAVVSDLRMPGMDGGAFWREVASRHPALARRILFVTGDTLSPDARDFLRDTDCPSLDKPFSKADLIRKVGALLG